MKVVRTGKTATIIMDYNKYGNPMPLPGFVSNAESSDFEIAEEAYVYYTQFYKPIKDSRNGTIT